MEELNLTLEQKRLRCLMLILVCNTYYSFMQFVFHLLVIEDHFEEESCTLPHFPPKISLKWKNSLASFQTEESMFNWLP